MTKPVEDDTDDELELSDDNEDELDETELDDALDEALEEALLETTSVDTLVAEDSGLTLEEDCTSHPVTSAPRSSKTIID